MTKPHHSNRSTYGAYRTRDEAVEAAHEWSFLLRGVPFGWTMWVVTRMGAWVVQLLRDEAR